MIVDGNVRSCRQDGASRRRRSVPVGTKFAAAAEVVAGGIRSGDGALQGRVIARDLGLAISRVFLHRAPGRVRLRRLAYVTAENTNSEMEGRKVEAQLDGDLRLNSGI